MASFLIAFRNLFGEKGRFFISIGGVAFSVILIVILLGLYQGWQKQMTKFLGNIPVDFWVAQKGTRDLSHTLSILPANLENQLTEIAGVDKVIPFIGRQVSFEKDGRESHLFLIGRDPDNIIKPYKILEGRESPDKDEIIVDTSFANEKNLKINDTLKINNKNFKISGISSGGNLLVYSYALADHDDVRQIFNSKDIVNYFLIQSQNPELTKTALKKDFPELAIIEKSDFLDQNASIVKDTFLPIMSVLLTLAFIVGLAVIGLTIFTATIEKSREYGVLKALGYTNGQLFGVALIQSLTAGIIGFGVGILLIPLIVKVALLSTSSFVFEAGTREIIWVLGAVLVMSALASFIPLKRLFSIDPAQAFKA